MTHLIACTVCGQPSKPDPFFYLWKGRRFTIHRCTACTHQFVHPPVTAQDQSEIYGDKYFSSDRDWVCGLIGASYVEAEPQLRSEAQEVLAMLPPPPGRLLDVGCAGGVFLDEARSSGFAVDGIELNPSMAKYARSKVANWLRPGGHVFIRGPLSDTPFARLKESARRILRLPKLLPGLPARRQHVQQAVTREPPKRHWLRTSFVD